MIAVRFLVLALLALDLTTGARPAEAGSRDPSLKTTDALLLVECNAALSLTNRLDRVQAVVLTDHTADPIRGKLFVREFRVPLIRLKRRKVGDSAPTAARHDGEPDYEVLIRVNRDKDRELLDAIRLRKRLTVIGLVHGPTLHGPRWHDRDPTLPKPNASGGEDR